MTKKKAAKKPTVKKAAVGKLEIRKDFVAPMVWPFDDMVAGDTFVLDYAYSDYEMEKAREFCKNANRMVSNKIFRGGNRFIPCIAYLDKNEGGVSWTEKRITVHAVDYDTYVKHYSHL